MNTLANQMRTMRVELAILRVKGECLMKVIDHEL